MGRVCPSCHYEMFKRMWVRDPDDSPELCDKHLMIEHPNDPCVECKKPHKDHTWGPSYFDNRVQALMCPVKGKRRW